MDDIKTIRRRNLKVIIARVGGNAKLARLMGGDFADRSSYIGQIVGKKSNRDVGDDFARDVERATGQLPNWLDRDHSNENVARPAAGTSVRVVRVIAWAQAGSLSSMDFAEGGSAESRTVYTSAEISDGAFALVVSGDSMVDPFGPRSYPNGCIIIVDPARRAKPGDRVIVKLTSTIEPTFKQLESDGGRLLLKPLNPRYPIVPMPPDGEIVGVVVQTQIDE